MALALASRLAARVLPTSEPNVRLEPGVTHAASPLLDHRVPPPPCGRLTTVSRSSSRCVVGFWLAGVVGFQAAVKAEARAARTAMSVAI
jgi:hypothetical protein